MEDTNSIGKIHGKEIKTGTSAGAAYVNKVTHPPSPMTDTYLGRPDCSQPNVVLLELKSEQNIPPILTIPASTSTFVTINPSSMLFLQTSGLNTSNYVFMQNTNSGVLGWVQPQSQAASGTATPAINQLVPPSIKNAGYNFNNWSADVAAFRTTYKSSTYYLNATNFNNQGTVTTAKFKPDIIRASDTTTFLKLFDNNPESLNNAKNALAAAIGQANIARRNNEKIKYVEDEGYEVIDTKAPNTKFTYQIFQFGTASGVVLPSVLSTTSYFNTVMPTTASKLLTLSPKAATRPAKDGAFVVLQQEGPIMDWVSNPDPSVANASNVPGLVLSFYRVNSGNVWSVAPLYSDGGVGLTVSPYTAETSWNNLDWSYTLFEGLTVPSSTGTTLSNVPYITVKSFVGVEVQVQPSSSLVSFQRTLPLPDPDAINMAVGIMHARPDSLPASANDLASIAATAVKFLPTAVGWLKDLFGSKEQSAQAVHKAREYVAPKEPNSKKKAPKPREDKRMDELTRTVNNLANIVKNNNAPATRLPTYNSNDKVKKPKERKLIGPRNMKMSRRPRNDH